MTTPAAATSSPHEPVSTAARSWLPCLFFYIGITIALLWQLLSLTRGHFIYALDDPYIHLTLARNIVHGTYGINPGEFTTPSSSILWPFFLTIGTSATWHHLVPLFWNIVFGIVAANLLGRIVDHWAWSSEGPASRWKRLLTCALFVLSANLFGLTFVGMEHTLQVLLAVACGYGVIQALNNREIPSWCLAAAVFGPAVRYENFAVTLALIIALYARKRAKPAVLTGLASLVIPVTFGLVLIAHGHSPLPNSVLVKANVYNVPGSTSLHLVTNIAFNLKMSLRNWPYLILLAAAIFVAVKARGQRAVILWGAVTALVLQLLIGRFGWFHRYEVYAVIFGTCVVFGALTDLRIRWLYVAAGLVLVGYPYMQAAMDVPFASLDIYRQQFQVARFLSDYYKQDVAVNDLGLSSYKRAPNVYVLDMIGLASDESRAAGPRNSAALEAMLHRRHIGLAVVYPQYFKIPESWYLVALLSEPRGANVASAFDTIGLYVTADGSIAQVREELQPFSTTLPGGDTLALRDPNDTPAALTPETPPILGPGPK